LLGESLDAAEQWRGRVGVLLVALLIPAFVVYGSYKSVPHPGSLRHFAERLGKERDKKRARRLVQASVAAILVLSLACTATLMYFGEWPQVWKFLEISGLFLELLA
jgi:hypothetical protein